MPTEEKRHTMPAIGQVMIKNPERGATRNFTLGRITSLEINADFDKDGKLIKVNTWTAWVVFKVHMHAAISSNDPYRPERDWHAPEGQELEWPGVKEALAADAAEQPPEAPATTPVPRPRGK